MATVVTILNEAKRGCGFRREGGLYLRADGPGFPCGKFPIILDICPTCGQGIKFARSWTWFDPSKLTEPGECGDSCAGAGCPMFEPPTKAGLIWIGEKHYKTPADWLKEAHEQGVSRRLKFLPHGFKIGEHWVFTAHKKVREAVCHECGVLTDEDSHDKDCAACKGTGKVWKAGIFHAFKPSRVEYIVTGKETEEELDKLEARGFTLIKLVRTDGGA